MTNWLRPLLRPWVRRLALVSLVGSFFFPVSGLGVDLCPLHAATGLPCPGCGLTRSLAAVSQGDFGAAMGLHPFIVVVWPGVLVLAVLALFPQRRVDAMAARLGALEPWLSRAGWLLLLAFVGYGAARFVVFVALRQSFP